jgi:hypothetical protein
MRSMILATAMSVAAWAAASSPASAAPSAPMQINDTASNVHKVQEFGIYIGPRYRYRDRYWNYEYGRGYGYYPEYYYGARRYYYGNDGYSYRDQRGTFRKLQRQAP